MDIHDGYVAELLEEQISDTKTSQWFGVGGEFYNRLTGKLSDQLVDLLIPVKYRECDDVPTMLERADNWAVHATPFLLAWDWLIQRALASDEGSETKIEITQRRFDTLSPVQKAIVQRGFQIKHLDACPPLMDATEYVYCVAIDYDILNNTDSMPARLVTESFELHHSYAALASVTLQETGLQ